MQTYYKLHTVRMIRTQTSTLIKCDIMSDGRYLTYYRRCRYVIHCYDFLATGGHTNTWAAANMANVD